MTELTHALRSALTGQIQELARDFSIELDARRAVAITTSQYTLVNAPVELGDVNELASVSDLLDGRPLMLLSIHTRDEQRPEGAVLVRADRSAQNRCLLTDATEVVVGRGMMRLTIGSIDPLISDWPDVSLNASEEKLCGDFSGSWKGVPYEVQACITIKIEGHVCIPKCS